MVNKPFAKEKTVLLVFTFNRPYHLKNLLNSLIINKESKKLPIIFFIDGPINKNDKFNVLKTKLIIKDFKENFPSTQIVERGENIGSKLNIINGVTDSLKIYKSAIILEDDLVIDKYFLRYMLKALNIYEYEKKIFHISGFSFLNNPQKSGSYLTRYMNCWGWATWSDRWGKLNKNSNEIMKKFSRKDIYEFNIENSHNFFRQIIENNIGILSTWAIFWYATIFKEKGLCLTPCNSLVNNQGYDGSGERFGNPISQSNLNGYIVKSFPKNIIEDKKELNQLKKYFRKEKNIFKTTIKKIIYLMPKKYQKPLINQLIKARFLVSKFLSDIFK